MSLNADQLFALLPAVYRTRDADAGGQLQAFCAVLAQQLAVVEDNIQQLYDDEFIETCAPWVIPYIGDLIGYNSIYEVAGAASDSRAEVANTIGYRRRKGTVLALEQVCSDISGRTAWVGEEFRRLITTESMRDVRPRHATTVNLRRMGALDRLGSAFDPTNRTIDVRRIAPRVRQVSDPDAAPLEIALHGPGHCNLPDISIHLWRLRSLPVVNAPAFSLGDGRYMFSPLRQNMSLFSQPPLRASFSRLTTRIDVPQAIDRFEFARSLANGTPEFYGSTGSILLIADGTPIQASRICCANLADLPGGDWCTVPQGLVAIDPELGRIRFAENVPPPAELRLNYSYGFPAEIGGGPYDRSASLENVHPGAADYCAVVGSSATPDIESAVAQWNSLAMSAPASTGVIILPNFESLSVDLAGSSAVMLPPGSNLTIAAGHPIVTDGVLSVIWSQSRVTLTGSIEVNGNAGVTSPEGATPPPGQLLMSGVWLAGQILMAGESAAVQLADATVVPGMGLTRCGDPLSPGDPAIVVTAAEATLTLTRVITGPIAATAAGSTRICSSIVDATSPCCVAYAGADLASAGADLHIEDSTVIGKVRTRTLSLASNTIFRARRPSRDPWAAAVWASRRQSGCVRFCSLPYDSITPRRYRCLPADQASEAALAPKFITLKYGRPEYALLSGDTPMAVWTGADNGSQIGAYYQIQETEAVRNVQVRAPEYLPVCLESGICLHPSRPLVEKRHPLFAYGSRPQRDCCDDASADQQHFSGIGGSLI